MTNIEDKLLFLEVEELVKMMEEVRQPGEKGKYESYQERLQGSKLSTEQA